MTTDPDRADRLAAQLRANLARRKQQARASAAPADAGDTPPLPPTPEDHRASASDPSDVAAPAA